VKVAIIGQGYVGLTISAYAAEFFEVIGFDNNQKIVDQLNSGISHIEGVDSSLLSKWVKAGSYKATSRAVDISDVDVVVIAVPTPLTEDRKPDLTFLESACRTIGGNLMRPALVINESTSFPGTLRNFIKPAI
jgi:UDP-N-acetyl-D-glucosamine dehydrogenase